MKKIIRAYNKETGKFLGVFDSEKDFFEAYPIHKALKGKAANLYEVEDWTEEIEAHLASLPIVEVLGGYHGSGDLWEGFAVADWHLSDGTAVREVSPSKYVDGNIKALYLEVKDAKYKDKVGNLWEDV